MLLIILALTFSTNAKASSPVVSSALTNLVTTTTNVNIVPLQIHALTGGWWRWIRRWWNNNCQVCGASNCNGHHDNNGNNGDGDNDSDDHSSDGNHGDQVPLDGGLGILALGAAAFGVRKLRGNKNDNI